MSTDPDTPRLLAHLRNEIDAQLLIDRLAELGIRAKMLSALLAVAPEVPPDVQVVVRSADLERAQSARAELAKRNPSVG